MNTAVINIKTEEVLYPIHTSHNVLASILVNVKKDPQIIKQRLKKFVNDCVSPFEYERFYKDNPYFGNLEEEVS